MEWSKIQQILKDANKRKLEERFVFGEDLRAKIRDRFYPDSPVVRLSWSSSGGPERRSRSCENRGNPLRPRPLVESRFWWPQEDPPLRGGRGEKTTEATKKANGSTSTGPPPGRGRTGCVDMKVWKRIFMNAHRAPSATNESAHEQAKTRHSIAGLPGLSRGRR